MVLESGIQAFRNISGTAKAAHRDGRQGALGRPFQAAQQIPAVAIGQVDIAQKNVESLFPERLPRGSQIPGETRLAAKHPEQQIQPVAHIRMIFDNKEMQRLQALWRAALLPPGSPFFT